MQGKSWRLGRLLHRAPGGGLGPQKPSLESSWRLTEPSWRLLESLGGVLGGLRGVLGGAGTALEAYKRRLGGSQGRLGAVLGPLEAMLEPSGGQKAPKMEPKRVPNRAPEATRAENCETLIFDDSCKDFNDFSCLRAPSWRQKLVQNGVRIVSSMLKASRSLLTGILEAILALLEVSWPLLDAS